MNANIMGIIIIIFGFVDDYWFIDSLYWVVHLTRGIGFLFGCKKFFFLIDVL